MIDFHSHILPKLDDGSRSTKESIDMMYRSASQGITAIVATPHFYAEKESPKEFLKRREHSWNRLKEACEGKDGFPFLYKGAEVRMFPGIAGIEELSELTIGGTPYILLEMSFETWSESTFRTLNAIRSRGLYPIIAHIERYISFQKGTQNMERLLRSDVLIQANAGAFLKRFGGSKWVIRMLSQKRIHLLGSDCHNMTSRPPNLGEGLDVIRKKLGEQTIQEITQRAEKILSRSEGTVFGS